MTVVEAMASGKPVIAPNEGGYKESIINQVNGILIDDINSEKIIDSVRIIEQELINVSNKYREECQKQSEKFSRDNFIKEIKKYIPDTSKIAIFHDYFRVLGGAEKLVLTLAKDLNADIITSEHGDNFILDEEFKNVTILPLGMTSNNLSFLTNICKKRFEKCNLSRKYDFYIFSGTFSIYAARIHRNNIWYCHTPLRGLYDLKNDKELL